MQIKSLLASFLLLASLGLATVMPTTVSAIDRDCDDNAVVHCGTLSLSELRENYKGDVKAVYDYFGIDQHMLSATDLIEDGYVTKTGDVMIGDKVVATDAITAGRKDMTGSTEFTAGGTTYYQRTPSVSFTKDKLEAFVFVDQNGEFLGAIIKACGNPVKATAKKVPVATCKAVSVNRISRTEYTFEASADVSGGATITGYTFTVTGPDNIKKTLTMRTNKAGVTSDRLTLDTAGAYKVVVTVATSEGDKTADNCAATFTVNEAPKPVQVEVCDPTTSKIITVDKDKAGTYKPKDDAACQPKEDTPKTDEIIASTGPTDMLAGVAGLGSVTAAGYYFRASRQRLLGALKK